MIDDPPPSLILLCDLAAEIELGLTITRDDLTEYEFRSLRILAEEREALKKRQAEYQAAVASRPAPRDAAID